MENHKTASTKQSIFLMSLFFLGETYIFTMWFAISSYIRCDVHFCNFNSKIWQFLWSCKSGLMCLDGNEILVG